MAFSRYLMVQGFAPGTTSMSTMSARIRLSVIRDELTVDTQILEEAQRLDQIAATRYGDASYWWVISAASGIGWGLQVPAGTVIVVPRDIGQVMSLMI